MADEHGHHDHGSEHGHAHGPSAHARTPARRLLVALVLTATFLVVEAVVGFLSHSLALLSDAGHMLTDAGALLLALVAQRVADRPRTEFHTFGFRRAEILAALLNGVVLGVTAVWVIVEAIRRFSHPEPVGGAWLMATASAGLVINLIAAWVLGSGKKESNANVQAAFAHVVADAAGSVAAMIAGVLVLAFGWVVADPIVSVVISLMILWGAWQLVRGSLGVLMEKTPTGHDSAKIAETIRNVPGVTELHDLHVWSISEGFPLVTVHVVLDKHAHGADVARRVSDQIRRVHGIEHVTVQPEAPQASTLVPAEDLLRKGGT
jgi:cobalt-zinc-cadmium efflux system protein